MPGFLAGLLGKLAGLGTLAKTAIAATTAALTMTVAGGAAGVLPLPGGHTDTAAAVQGALHPTPVAAASVSGSVSPAAAGTATGAPVAGGASASASIGSTSASTHASVGAAPPAAGPAVAAAAQPAPGAAGAALPTLPALPACVKNLIPAKGTTPDPSKFVAQLVACVKSLVAAHFPAANIDGMLGSAGLPANLATCVSSAFASMPGLAAGTTAGFSPSQVLTACMPTGSIPGLGSTPIPGLGAFPGKGAVPGK